MSSGSWIYKYCPLKISDIVCNRAASTSIQAWLKNWDINKTKVLNHQKEKLKSNFKDNKSKAKIKPKIKVKFEPSCLTITGSHGVGKSVTVDVIVKEFGYEVQTIDFNNIKLGKNIRACIQEIIKTDNVLDLINSVNPKKKIIVFDEVESISASTDKAFIIALQKLNDLERLYPIIFISNNHHNKMLTDIKKNSITIKFWDPYEDDLKKILRKIAIKEKIKIINEKVVSKIIDRCQSDIRRLIHTLQDIQYTYGNTPITEPIIKDYFKISKLKDIDTDLYKATSCLLNEYNNIDKCLSHFESEKTLLPLMIHENYYKNTLSRYKNPNLRYKIINNVSNMLSDGDVIENYIYGDQSWDMQEIHGFFTCAATSFYLNSETNICKPIKKDNSCDDDDDLEHIFDDYTTPKTKAGGLEFTKDLNKTSIKKINKKNINKTNGVFNNMNISDYIYINKIIRNQIASEKIKECVDTMKFYKIKLEHIECLLKIDKIKDNNTSLTLKQKKEFKKYLEEI